MATVRNRAIDLLRRQAASKRPQTTAMPVADLVEAQSPPPIDAMVGSDVRDALDEQLIRLPAAQSEVINLAFFGELTHLEIAELLDLPPGTVKGRMRLGLEKLRREIDLSV